MSLQGNLKRLQVLVVAVPVFVGTSYVLYKRVVLGEEQRKFDRSGKTDGPLLDRPPPLKEIVHTLEEKPATRRPS